MHGYRVRDSGARRKAKGVRGEADRADREAEEEVPGRWKARKGKGKGKGKLGGEEHEDDSEQQEPLMEGEVTRSQEGVGEGELRAYAHRDIKPGMCTSSIDHPCNLPLTYGTRQHHDR